MLTQTDILAALGTCVACGAEPAEKGSRYGARCIGDAKVVRARIEAGHFERRDRARKVQP